jgi:hypothetical protein
MVSHLGLTDMNAGPPTPVHVSEAATGAHAALLFLACTLAVIVLAYGLVALPSGAVVLGVPKALWSPVAVMLAFVMVGALSLSEDRSDFYAAFVFALLFFGPLAAFVVAPQPRLYLIHILASATYLALVSKQHSTGAAGFAALGNTFVAFSITTILWLSLASLPHNPWAPYIEQADKEALGLAGPLLTRLHMPTAATTFVGLRLSTAFVTIAALAILAMAQAIRASVPSVAPLHQWRLPDPNGVNMALTPMVVIFNACANALYALASFVWFTLATSTIYLYEFIELFLRLLYDRVVASGLLMGLLRCLLVYVSWIGIVIVSMHIPAQLFQFVSAESGYSRTALVHLAAGAGFAVVGMMILCVLVNAILDEPPPAMLVNMSHGLQVALLSVVFGVLAVYTLSSVGFVHLGQVYQLAAFLVIVGSCVGATMIGLLFVQAFMPKPK